MQNLNIETGIKTFTINNDPDKTIAFNPGDLNIITRFNEARKVVLSLEDNLKRDIEVDEAGNPVQEDEEAVKIIEKLDKTIREQMDYIFAYPVSGVVFGTINPLATIKGVPYFERFINAVQPFIEKEIAEEQKASAQRVSKYTGKYKGKKK